MTLDPRQCSNNQVQSTPLLPICMAPLTWCCPCVACAGPLARLTSAGVRCRVLFFQRSSYVPPPSFADRASLCSATLWKAAQFWLLCTNWIAVTRYVNPGGFLSYAGMLESRFGKIQLLSMFCFWKTIYNMEFRRRACNLLADAAGSQPVLLCLDVASHIKPCHSCAVHLATVAATDAQSHLPDCYWSVYSCICPNFGSRVFS